eukprot:scaffold36905_cov20-Tisochrysis_lutea.AAC.1
MDSMSLSSITEVHGHSTWMLGVQNRQSMHWPSSWHAYLAYTFLSFIVGLGPSPRYVSNIFNLTGAGHTLLNLLKFPPVSLISTNLVSWAGCVQFRHEDPLLKSLAAC